MSSASATAPRPSVVKDVINLDTDQLILDRSWNGRWTAIKDEVEADEKAPLSADLMVSIRSIANSMAEKGQLEDVLVWEDKPDSKGRIYHVAAGFSRTRAVELLNKEDAHKNLKVRCRILPKSLVKNAKDAFLINEDENRQRNNLTLLDKAYCMKRERDDLGMAVADIAKRWGCSVPAVAQALSLIDSPDEVQQAVYDKAVSATDVIDKFKHLSKEDKLDIAKTAQEAKKKGTPLKSSQISEMARARVAAAAEAKAKAEADAKAKNVSTTPAAAGNGIGTKVEPPAPAKPRGRGRPATATDRTPRGIADFRKAIKGREGVLSQTLLRYFDGFADVTDEVLCAVLNEHETVDGDKTKTFVPRTEGAKTETESETESESEIEERELTNTPGPEA